MSDNLTCSILNMPEYETRTYSEYRPSGLHCNTFVRIEDAYRYAKNKHPEFAIGVFHALGFLGEEYGEVVREITKQKDGWEERMQKELLDLIAVALRMLMGEWK